MGVAVGDGRIIRYSDAEVQRRGTFDGGGVLYAPPHFHAIYAEDEASIDIRTLTVVRGAMPRRALAMILEWASLHREELLQDWDLCAKKQTPRKIPPLV